MIALKLQHNHRLPCHPTRRLLEYEASINETDREHNSDQQSEQQDNHEFKIIQSRAINHIGSDSKNNQSVDDIQFSEDGSIKKKIQKKKNKYKINQLATPKQIYDAPLLDKAYTASSAKLPVNIQALLMQKQKLIEDKVYIGFTSESTYKGNSIVLQKLYGDDINTDNIHIHVKQELGLTDMMNQITSRIDEDINYTDQYYVHKIIRSNKNDILNNRKGRLNMNYAQTNYSTSSFPNNPNHRTSEGDNETVNSQPIGQNNQEFDLSETKKADNFVKKIQQEQETQRKRRKQHEEKKKKTKAEELEERKNFEEEIKQERRNYLKRRFEMKREMREKEIELRDKKNKEYRELLIKHKKKNPLFMKKEQQFELEKSMEEEQLRNHILGKRKNELKPIRSEDLREHEQKYLQFKKEKQSLKEKQREMRLAENKNKITYPKSKYFDILIEQQTKQKERQTKQDPKFVRSELIKKRDNYSKSVRTNYIPKNSILKHQQLENAMQKLKWSEQLRKHKKGDRQHIEQGDKNLKQLHQQIEELREQGKLREQISTGNNTIDYYTPQKPKYKNYLEDNRSRRTLSIDYDRNATIDFEGLQNLAKKYQLQANRRYAFANSYQKIEDNFREVKQADHQYLESVKAKVALLNKLNQDP